MMKTLSPLFERFASKVEVSGDCWLWVAGLTEKGYGQFSVDKKQMRAHRWSYEHFIGPIPEGLVIDHLCRQRNCVFPGHLKPVTNAQNTIAGLNGARAFHFVLTGEDLHEKAGYSR